MVQQMDIPVTKGRECLFNAAMKLNCVCDIRLLMVFLDDKVCNVSTIKQIQVRKKEKSSMH
jgi:hypothetical protein